MVKLYGKEADMSNAPTKGKRLDTNRRILEAAKEVFSESGFAGARVDEIATRAGVNKATIYYHIGDKKTLYAEVIHGVLGNTAEKIAQDFDKTARPEEKLRRYIRTVAQTIEHNPQMAPIIMREIASGAQHIPDIIPRDMARIIGLLSEILEEGKNKGIFVETMPFVVHLMVIGSLLFYKAGAKIRNKHRELALIFRHDDPGNSEKVAEEVEKLMVQAVTRRSQSSTGECRQHSTETEEHKQ